MKTLIATLNWNDISRTKRCINSLVKVSEKNTSIIIIDNNSKNDDFEKLCSFVKKKSSSYLKIDYLSLFKKKNKIQNKKFYLLKIPFNSGCTGGFNFAYKFALINDFDLVSRIDNDCTVQKNYLSRKINYLKKNPNVIGINSKVCYLQKKNKIQWVGAFRKNNLIFFKSLRPFKKTINLNDFPKDLHAKNWKGYKKTDFLNGPGSLIRVSALKKTGLSNIEFFFGPEDIELSNRLRCHGTLMLCLDSIIFHEVAQSQDLTGIKKRRYYEMKSSLLLLKLIGSFKERFFGYQFYILRSLYYLFSSVLLTKNLSQFLISVIALKDFILGKLGINDLKNINSNINKKIILKYINEFRYN